MKGLRDRVAITLGDSERQTSAAPVRAIRYHHRPTGCTVMRSADAAGHWQPVRVNLAAGEYSLDDLMRLRVGLAGVVRLAAWLGAFDDRQLDRIVATDGLY